MALATFGLEFPGFVHPGIASLLFHQDLDQIERRAKEAARRGGGLVLAGHSQGGVLATLTAAHLDSKKIPVNAVYTFGSPRVGDEAFRSSYDQKIAHGRFEHIGDLVPMLFPPPGSLSALADFLLHLLLPDFPPTFVDYKHVGDLCGLTWDDDFLTMGDEVLAWLFSDQENVRVIARVFAFMDQLMETVSRLGVLNALTKTFKYHTMPEYIREIENMA